MPNSTTWTGQTITSTTWSTDPSTKNGIKMDDTVCKMEDSTYTMDDANPSTL